MNHNREQMRRVLEWYSGMAAEARAADVVAEAEALIALTPLDEFRRTVTRRALGWQS